MRTLLPLLAILVAACSIEAPPVPEDSRDPQLALDPSTPRVEICDGYDNDGDGWIDEGFDRDGDGYVSCMDDCDDEDPSIPDWNDSVCDGVDRDCDGTPEVDDDGDGFLGCAECDDANPEVHPGVVDDLCDGIDLDCADDEDDTDADGWRVCDGDCDDQAASVAPGLAEVCDATDNDCDGDIDEGMTDADGDGWVECLDCDDDEATVYPGAPHLCDGLFNNCNQPNFEPNNADSDGDGYGPCDGDCAEGPIYGDTFLQNPGAPEICNLIDDDCDGLVDEGFDLDGDGWFACGADGVLGTLDDDCGDGSLSIPGVEVCNGIDDDCDGLADTPFDADADGVSTCGPDGVPGTADDDCDDSDPERRPGVVDLPDGVDSDCDGTDFILRPAPSIPSAYQLRSHVSFVVNTMRADPTGLLEPSSCQTTTSSVANAAILPFTTVPGWSSASWLACGAGPEVGGGASVLYSGAETGLPNMAHLSPGMTCGSWSGSGSWVETPWLARDGAARSGYAYSVSTNAYPTLGCAYGCSDPWSTHTYRGGDFVIDVGPTGVPELPGLAEGSHEWTWSFDDHASNSWGVCGTDFTDTLDLEVTSHATTTPWLVSGVTTWEFSSWNDYYGQVTTGCTVEPSSGSITAEVLDAPGGQPLLTIELTFGGACDGCIDWTVDGVAQTPWCTTALEMQ